jgi:ABC-2 type transport system permease protein
MSGRRLAAVFRRVAQEIRRDHRSLALLFVVPIVMTGLVTFIVREGQSPVVDAVVANQAGVAGIGATRALDEALSGTGGSATIVADEAAARAAIEDGSASIAIFLPAGLGTSGGSTTVTLLTDGLDPSGEATQVAAVQRAMLAAVGTFSGLSLPTVEHVTLYGVPSDDPLAPFAPAILAFLAYFFVYILTGISFLRERTGGTLERLMATPVTRGEVVLGYTLGFGLFATIQVGLLLAWSLGSVEVPALGPLPAFSVGLGLPNAGSALVAYLVIVVTALGAVSLGIFLSTFARTELQVVQFIPIVIVPQFLLSGVLFPISGLPEILQPLVQLMPLTWAADGLRRVLIAGAGLTDSALQLDLLVLTVVALFFAAIAALTIRREVA